MNLVDNDLHKLIFAGDRHEVVGKMGCLGVFRRHVYNPRLWLIVDARQPSRICDLEISASAFEFRMECREGEEDKCDPMVALALGADPPLPGRQIEGFLRVFKQYTQDQPTG